MLDTALALQLRAPGRSWSPARASWPRSLAERAREHVDTVCIGRTHGVHAEPTTFGVKLAGFAMEARRNAERLERAFAQAAVGAMSGAVGTYSATTPRSRRAVLERLGLEAEPVSTQVVPRDRHAELLQAIALAGAGLERLATEIRHLQRTEVGEAEEPFRAGPRRAPARCRTSATRSPPSASRAWRACCAATRPPAWRTSRCGTSATSRTRAPSA